MNAGLALPVYFGNGRCPSIRFTAINPKFRAKTDQVSLKHTKDSSRKVYSASERFKAAMQAARQEIKRSWEFKYYLAFGPLCLLAIPFPVLLPACFGTMLPFFGIALYELWEKGRAAYKSPETFLKNKK